MGALRGEESLGVEIERERRKLGRLDEGIGRLLDALESHPSVSISTRLAEREREAEEIRSRIAELGQRCTWEERAPITHDELVAMIESLEQTLQSGAPEEQQAVMSAVVLGVTMFNDQVEIAYALPLPNQKRSELSTPSGAIRPSSRTFQVLFERTRLRNFNPRAQRQCRYRTVTPRGEVKVLGKRLYVGSHLAGARVMVKLSNGLATIYHRELVIQKQI